VGVGPQALGPWRVRGPRSALQVQGCPLRCSPVIYSTRGSVATVVRTLILQATSDASFEAWRKRRWRPDWRFVPKVLSRARQPHPANNTRRARRGEQTAGEVANRAALTSSNAGRHLVPPGLRRGRGAPGLAAISEEEHPACMANRPRAIACSFCGKARHQVRRLIAGPGIFICNECVRLCNEIMAESPPPVQPTTGVTPATVRPREVSWWQRLLPHRRQLPSMT